MSFSESNIKIAAINQTIKGGSFDFQTLCRHPHVNPLSYYGPGRPGVDSNKNIIFVPSNVNDPGDFRLYDHDALPPNIWQIPGYLGWRGVTMDFTLLYQLNQLNLYAFADRGDYITIDIYHTPADRLAGSGRMYRSSPPFAIPVYADTPLTRHSRQSAFRPNTGYNRCDIVGLFTSWLASPDDYLYAEFYISDLANNKKICLGRTRADGFATFQTHYMANPYMFGQNTNTPHPPSGYTAIFPALSSSGGNVCSYVTNIDQSLGSTYAFNIVAKGIYGSSPRVVALDSVDIILTIGSIRTVVATGVQLYYNAGRSFSGNLSSGSWTAGSIGAITFENAIIQSVPNYTQC
jgi:hypothetical protein